jgi:hypothetical protein
VSRPVVVDLESLQQQPLQPEVPAGVTSNDSLMEPWFTLTDMAWDAGEVVITGEVHAPVGDEGCDADPAIWQRRFDPATGRLNDTGDIGARATRWFGPDCTDVIDVTGPYEDAVVTRRTGGTEEQLGRYHQVSLGMPRPADC